MKSHIESGIFILLVLSFGMTRGQDPNFSQFNNNPIYYNPAMTGLHTGFHGYFTFRNQWPALPYDFKSYQFSAEVGDRNLPGAGGLGLFFSTDNQGIGYIKNLNLGISLGVRIPIVERLVSQIGIKASWFQKRINWDDLVFPDELSEKLGNILPTNFINPDRNVINAADFGAGGLIQGANPNNNLNIILGFAVDHLFQPNMSFLKTGEAPIPRKWVVHLDMLISTISGSLLSNADPNDLKINLGCYYQNQAGLNSIQAGLNLTKFGVYAGLWYKGAFGTYANSLMVLLAGYRYSFSEEMGIKFTYSYDMQMTGVLQGTGGAHEISLVLDLNNVSLFGGSGGGSNRIFEGGRQSGNPIECPQF